MQRFICAQNISHFENLLSGATDPNLHRTLLYLLSSAKREYALLSSTMTGADMSPFEQRWRQLGDPAAIKEHFQPEFEASAHPYMLIDPGPGLKIVDVNDAYAKATFINRDDVVGKSLFDIFPDDPEDALADGVSNLYSSLRTVAPTGKPHAMAVQRYDIRDPSCEFVERHWQPINTPI